jgi:hypothetical protein
MDMHCAEAYNSEKGDPDPQKNYYSGAWMAVKARNRDLEVLDISRRIFAPL